MMHSSLLLFSLLPPICAAGISSKNGVIVALAIVSSIILLILFTAWKIRRYIQDSERDALNEIMDDRRHSRSGKSVRKDSPEATYAK